MLLRLVWFGSPGKARLEYYSQHLALPHRAPHTWVPTLQRQGLQTDTLRRTPRNAGQVIPPPTSPPSSDCTLGLHNVLHLLVVWGLWGVGRALPLHGVAVSRRLHGGAEWPVTPAGLSLVAGAGTLPKLGPPTGGPASWSLRAPWEAERLVLAAQRPCVRGAGASTVPNCPVGSSIGSDLFTVFLGLPSCKSTLDLLKAIYP